MANANVRARLEQTAAVVTHEEQQSIIRELRAALKQVRPTGSNAVLFVKRLARFPARRRMRPLF